LSYRDIGCRRQYASKRAILTLAGPRTPMH